VGSLTQPERVRATELLQAHAENVARKAAAQAFSVSGQGGSTVYLDPPPRTIVDMITGYGVPILAAAEALASARIGRGSLSLVDMQPMPRVLLTIGKVKVKANPYALLREVLLIRQKGGGGAYPDRSVMEAVEAMDPVLGPYLAAVRADALNSVQKALADERVTSPIRERLDKKRALMRSKAVETTKHHFAGIRGLLTEDEVVALWREGLVGEVMDS